MAATSTRVVIVDDDAHVLRSISRLLKICGFHADGFASAEAFLASGVIKEAGCVVIDIRLRGMSGIALRRKLTADNCSVPVIFITAADDQATYREALDAGCVAYLRKPFEAHLLIGAIRQVG